MNTPDLSERIGQIKQALASLGPMRPGSLSEQYNVCGTAGCHCKDPKKPEKHGPYYQLGWTRNGKSTTRFVRSSELVTVRKQLKNYARLQSLVQEWVDLSIELCDIKLREGKLR